jgi:hypothetical protein
MTRDVRASALATVVVLAVGAAAAAAAPAGAVSSYSVTAMSHQVLRWNPCASVAVRVDVHGAPSGALADVEHALSLVDRASGLRLHYAGSTTSIPNRGNWKSYRGITVAWARSTQSDLLGQGQAGEGGYVASTDGSGRWRITSAFVVVDTRYNYLHGGFGTGGTRGALLLHELGHAVGLNHVPDARQIMYPKITSKAAAYAAGDVAGLHRVGAAAGCIR